MRQFWRQASGYYASKGRGPRTFCLCDVQFNHFVILYGRTQRLEKINGPNKWANEPKAWSKQNWCCDSDHSNTNRTCENIDAYHFNFSVAVFSRLVDVRSIVNVAWNYLKTGRLCSLQCDITFDVDVSTILQGCPLSMTVFAHPFFFNNRRAIECYQNGYVDKCLDYRTSLSTLLRPLMVQYLQPMQMRKQSHHQIPCTVHW